MNYLNKFLIDSIIEDVAKLLSSESAPVRVLFSGLPVPMLEDIYKGMECEGTTVEISSDSFVKRVPVLLVDSNTNEEPSGAISGRCSHEHLVSIRNADEGSYLAMHPVDADINLSSKSAADLIGVLNHHHNMEEWLEEPFIHNILLSILSRYDSSFHQQIEKVICIVLSEAWENDQRYKDRRNVWNILSSVYQVSISNSEISTLYKILGLPKLESITDEDVFKAITLPFKIAEYFSNYGFKAGEEQLINENPDDSGEIKEALICFVGDIREECTTSPEFLSNPLKNYALIGTQADSSWWSLLTDQVWLKLLDNSDEVTYAEINVSCSNIIYTPVNKAHPDVVQSFSEFIIEPLEIDEDIKLEIWKSSGSKKPTLIDNLVINETSLTWPDKAYGYEHERFIKYQFISEKLAKPITIKVINLSSYTPKTTVNCRSAIKITPFKFKAQKGKKAKENNEGHYECDIEINGTGSHTLDIYYDKDMDISPQMIGYLSNRVSEQTFEKNITVSSACHSISLIEAEEDCTYEFQINEAESSQSITYKVNITVSDYISKGVSSEFRKLISQCCGIKSVPKVEVRQSLLTNLENWILDSHESYFPVVFGTGLKNKWRIPNWKSAPIISEMTLFLDPRPTPEKIEASIPKTYLESREAVRRLIKSACKESGGSIESLNLGILYINEEFSAAIDRYISEYYEWLKNDEDDVTIWIDIVTIHSEESSNNCLEAVPDAILLSPMHPVRLAWQCNAQNILIDAIKNEVSSPAAGVIDPSAFPDCMVLPCLNANSRPEAKGFASVRTSSDYWSVLWNTDIISNIGDGKYESIFCTELGLTIDGMAQGFSIQQVKRSLDDVRQLASAKSTLRLSLTTDISGISSCNSGVEEWVEQNMGTEKDEWSDAGANSLHVFDTRPINAQPEPAILAALTEKSGTNVRWYTQQKGNDSEKIDLAIVDHLKTISNKFQQHYFNSPVDPTGLYRISIKHSFTNNYKFLAQSRVGHYSLRSILEDKSLRNTLLNTLDIIESACSVKYTLFDSLVFAPHLKTLEDSLKNTDFCAVSSSTVDASCFHMPDYTSLLWDYELPKYSSEVGQSSGFYLLAHESPNMHLALHNALSEFQGDKSLSEEKSRSLLQEISLRGMPTLKKLTSGGTSSFGEVGMLVALRLLQTEFQSECSFDGIMPVIQHSRLINLIVPADIFQPRFDSLRGLLKQTSMERPDLIVISIAFSDDDEAESIRLTALEVKARNDTMTSSSRIEALKQAIIFADFLEKMKKEASNNELWGITWREMLSSWIDYGFRVYGEVKSIRKLDTRWSKLHEATIKKLMSSEVTIDVDHRGRLISLEKCEYGKVISTNQNDFNDTVILSHNSAAGLLVGNQEQIINDIREEIGDWNLLASSEPNSGGIKQPNGQLVIEPELTGVSKNTVEITLPIFEPVSKTGQDISPCSGIKFKIGESLDRYGSKDAVFNPGNTALNNINIGVVGDLGTGKTQLLKSIIYQMTENPADNRGEAPKILILDYKGDFSEVNDNNVKFLEKAKVKIVKPKDLPLNIFNTSDSSASIPWLDRYSFFRDVLSKIYNTQKPIQDANLKKAVKTCFKNINGRDPTIYDVFQEYTDIVEGKPDTTLSILDDLIDNELFESNPAKILPFGEFFDGVIALDLKGISDEKIKRMVIVIFLNFYFDYMMKIVKKPFLGDDPQTRFIDSYLLVDEAHNIMPYDFDVLSKLLLQGREFGVGVILASQYFSHFRQNKVDYMQPIKSWFVHEVSGVKGIDLDRIGLPTAGQETINRISSLGQFESLCNTLGHKGDFIKATPFYRLTEDD